LKRSLLENLNQEEFRRRAGKRFESNCVLVGPEFGFKPMTVEPGESQLQIKLSRPIGSGNEFVACIDVIGKMDARSRARSGACEIYWPIVERMGRGPHPARRLKESSFASMP
jgi:hypothetical protein